MKIDIETLKKQHNHPPEKKPHPHQEEAINALTEVFNFKDNQTKGGLLVLPTGSGKTFTTVKWLVDNVIPKNVRVLWLAHTFHLLDQAYEVFLENAHRIEKRGILNIRLISSHSSHEKAASIDPVSDDILVMTTQTAISNWQYNAVDDSNKGMVSNFRNFIAHSKATRLCVILDEAHHAPAYGCRNLLLDIRKAVPNVYILGLTATPTYEDETKRGWLKKIFEQEIIYRAEQAKLIAQNILAAPEFI